MRCDLHVHTRYSGPVDLPGLRHVSRECYSDPGAVYETAKRRGMDLVTITDHDTIEGALLLAHLPDFIVGEEVTLDLGQGRQVHLGVWDLDESRHHRISELRNDPEGLFAWLAENRVPACVNHPFSPLTGARSTDDFHRVFEGLTLIETQNGMMPRATNEFAFRAGRQHGLAPVGGSDAHTLFGIGHAFTTVPQARNRAEFLQGLREGFTVPSGGSGSYARLTADVCRVFAGTVRENVARALGSPRDFARFLAITPAVPILALIPLITLASFAREVWGGRALDASYRASRSSRQLRGRAAFLGPRLALGGE